MSKVDIDHLRHWFGRGNDLSVNTAPDDNGLIVWIGLPGGAVSMRAEAGF
jgi:hypothetical protein